MPNGTPLPSHKVPRITRAKAKKAPMCSVSLIAIELKGLAAPGEALKNILSSRVGRVLSVVSIGGRLAFRREFGAFRKDEMRSILQSATGEKD